MEPLVFTTIVQLTLAEYRGSRGSPPEGPSGLFQQRVLNNRLFCFVAEPEPSLPEVYINTF